MITKRAQTRRSPGALVAALIGWALAGLVYAEDSQCVRVKPGVRWGETIGIEYGPEVKPQLVDAAIAHWERCNDYRDGFPAFINGGPGTRNVRVQVVAGSSGSAKCGSFSGSTIVLYGFAFDAQGRIRFCGSTARLLAHELGHVLGLSDCPAKRRCRSALMSAVSLDRTLRPTTTREECAAVNERWRTPAETTEWAAMVLEVASEDEPVVVAGDTRPSVEVGEPPLPS